MGFLHLQMATFSSLSHLCDHTSGSVGTTQLHLPPVSPSPIVCEHALRRVVSNIPILLSNPLFLHLQFYLKLPQLDHYETLIHRDTVYLFSPIANLSSTFVNSVL